MTHADYLATSPDSIYEHTARELTEKFEAYRHDPDLLELVARLSDARGIEVPDPTKDEESFMTATQRVFNFREEDKPREQAVEGDLSQDIKDLAEKLVEKFDMRRNTEPQNPDFDAVLVLGGAGITPKTRLEYALDLEKQDKLRAPALVMVGGERPVNDAEIGRAGEAGHNFGGDPAETEFDLMRNTIAKKLSISDEEWQYYDGDDPKVPRDQGFHTSWRVAYTRKNDQEIIVTSAPMIDDDRYVPDTNPPKPRNRANTVDSLLFAARFLNMGRVDGGRFGVVTNAVFVPFQDADSKKALAGYNIDTETVGMTREYSGLPEWRDGDERYYIQEILSAIRSTRFARDRLNTI